MKIDFDEGEAGFYEARALFSLTREARHVLHAHRDLELLQFLHDAAGEHMARGEFDGLRARVGISDEVWPSFSIIKHLWRRTVGPTDVETDLSEQRSAALERAERAERSVFEALAESAKLARERDEARAEALRLRQALAASDVK
ncbi:MAG: hypothetical protein HYX63_15555 [Gammaproteobacteria bacterium]|nr:hypothetical protein [Gammaproteobacteria bacterium]